jgi:hypothetical protein
MKTGRPVVIVKYYEYQTGRTCFYFHPDRDSHLPDDVLTAFEENTMWQEYYDRKEFDILTEGRYK